MIIEGIKEFRRNARDANIFLRNIPEQLINVGSAYLVYEGSQHAMRTKTGYGIGNVLAENGANFTTQAVEYANGSANRFTESPNELAINVNSGLAGIIMALIVGQITARVFRKRA